MKISNIILRKKCQSPIEMKMYDYLVEWGIEFENQKKVNPYVLDFYIPSLKTCIEVDGFEEHKNRKLYDKLRDEYILLKQKIS